MELTDVELEASESREIDFGKIAIDDDIPRKTVVPFPVLGSHHTFTLPGSTILTSSANGSMK